MPSTEASSGVAAIGTPAIAIAPSLAPSRATSLREAYDALIAARHWQADFDQIAILEKLDDLCRRIAAEAGAAPSLWRRLFAVAGRATDKSRRGLYIHGAVGRGKSMLMDLFFAAAPLAAKRRVHFHAFMQEIHGELHLWRQRRMGARDPLLRLADRLAEKTRLLCFDEFHVGNIADAMILGRLFAALFARGVIVVATSNDAPDDLYAGGLQRDRFLPFIALLKQRLDIGELRGRRDYRLERLRDMRLYHSPLGEESRRRMAESFRRLTDGAEGAPVALEVHGRQWIVPRAAGRIAWLDFDTLCRRALGAADYLSLAARFDAVLIDNVLRLGVADADAAQRFLTLIDALYERRTMTIIAAADRPEALFPTGSDGHPFARAISRLVEMQSADYLRQPLLT